MFFINIYIGSIKSIHHFIHQDHILINRTLYIYPFNPIFVMPSAVKPFEILSKHRGCEFISESLSLN